VTCLACGEPMTPITGIRVHPTCQTNPDVSASSLFGLIESDIVGQPRTLQTRIGPSEIGVPCDRRLGYKLAGVPEVNARDVAWKPYVGTALHEQIGNLMARHEIARFDDDNDATPRFHVEERVSVGQVNGVEITGSCDLFDEHTGIVWDWKFTTRNKIRETYRPHGPGEQYRVQAHLYGYGWARQGKDIRHVGVVFMTRDGEFHDRHVWHEPYDQQVALDALQRLEGIAVAIEHLGGEFTIPTLSTASAYCNFCPWHKTNATEIPRSCPGHSKQEAATQTLTQLIGA